MSTCNFVFLCGPRWKKFVKPISSSYLFLVLFCFSSKNSWTRPPWKCFQNRWPPLFVSREKKIRFRFVRFPQLKKKICWQHVTNLIETRSETVRPRRGTGREWGLHSCRDHDRCGRSTAEHKAGARHLTTRFILGSALPSLPPPPFFSLSISHTHTLHYLLLDESPTGYTTSGREETLRVSRKSLFPIFLLILFGWNGRWWWWGREL